MLPKIPSPLNILFGFSLILTILILFNYFIGWYELAELYQTNLKLVDNNITDKSKNYRCRISRDLNGSVVGNYTIAFLEAGIYINPGFDSVPIFSAIQTPLLIPWQEVGKYEIIASEKHHFYLGNPPISILVLSMRSVRELEALSGIQVSDRLSRD